MVVEESKMQSMHVRVKKLVLDSKRVQAESAKLNQIIDDLQKQRTKPAKRYRISSRIMEI